LLKVDFVGFSYDEENGSNTIAAYVLVINVYKNNSSDDIVVPNVDKDQPILDEYSDDEEQFFTKAHTKRISNQPIYGNEEYKEELHQHFYLPTIDEKKSLRISELKQHMSNYGSYEDYHFVEKSAFTEEHDCFLKQLKMCHVLQDPMVIWMDSLLAQVPIVVTLGISLICSSECNIFLELLLKKLPYICIFSKRFLQVVIFISQLLSWLLWKFDYT
jgi:hypothetical protein